ncbi:hypothetical protein PSAB6_450108 [Paraburkholderia sabiae]|nr:hypothetical protein PSAB6_450108 [Paraburkholderia sabiae]
MVGVAGWAGGRPSNGVQAGADGRSFQQCVETNADRRALIRETDQHLAGISHRSASTHAGGARSGARHSAGNSDRFRVLIHRSGATGGNQNRRQDSCVGNAQFFFVAILRGEARVRVDSRYRAGATR